MLNGGQRVDCIDFIFCRQINKRKKDERNNDNNETRATTGQLESQVKIYIHTVHAQEYRSVMIYRQYLVCCPILWRLWAYRD